MASLPLYDAAGKELGQVEAPEQIFGVPENDTLVHQAVTIQLANRRAGTADTRTRGEVRGGGRKPWRQKGTGRARAGSRRAPHWVGGGTIFGPHPRSYRQRLPKKERRLALLAALSGRAAGGQVVVLDQLQIERPNTKQLAGILNSLGLPPGSLLVVDQISDALGLSARNIPGLELATPGELNTYRVMAARRLVFTRAGLESLGRSWERAEK